MSERDCEHKVESVHSAFPGKFAEIFEKSNIIKWYKLLPQYECENGDDSLKKEIEEKHTACTSDHTIYNSAHTTDSGSRSWYPETWICMADSST